MTYVHVVHGWVWKWGQQVGGNANWPCLGGSSGGDDLYKTAGIAIYSYHKQWKQLSCKCSVFFCH